MIRRLLQGYKKKEAKGTKVCQRVWPAVVAEPHAGRAGKDRLGGVSQTMKKISVSSTMSSAYFVSFFFFWWRWGRAVLHIINNLL